jgi:hypothetical protein
MQWEYRIEIFDSNNINKVQELLNNFGSYGWELINVSDDFQTYFFKRIKEEKEERC